MPKPNDQLVRRARRRVAALLSRKELANAARITAEDIVHAQITWHQDAPPVWRTLLDARRTKP